MALPSPTLASLSSSSSSTTSSHSAFVEKKVFTPFQKVKLLWQRQNFSFFWTKLKTLLQTKKSQKWIFRRLGKKPRKKILTLAARKFSSQVSLDSKNGKNLSSCTLIIYESRLLQTNLLHKIEKILKKRTIVFFHLPLSTHSCSRSFSLSCPRRLTSRLELDSQGGLTTYHLSSCSLIQHAEGLSAMRAEADEVIVNRGLINWVLQLDGQGFKSHS